MLNRRALLRLGAAALAPVRSAGAARLPMEQTDLFFHGTDDYALYRIPGIVVTPKGAVLAYCEARRTGKSDWDTIDLFLRRSPDGGRTWEPARRLPGVEGPKTKNPVALRQNLADPADVTYNNPVAIPDPATGAIHLLFCLEYCRCFYSRSDDDGRTFSPPVEITAAFERFRPVYDWRVFATGPGHGIRLRSGRLLVPVWLSTGTGGHAHRPSVTSVLYSDDGGRSWQPGEIAVPNTEEWINPSEAAAVELADGRVMLNVRSESRAHRRLVTISPDGATRWSRPEFQDALLEPICMGSLARLNSGAEPARTGLRPATGADGDIPPLLFANPDTLEPRTPPAPGGQPPSPGQPRARRNVSVRASFDDGRTWPAKRVIEPGPSGYSDLASTKDGTILCFYERGAASVRRDAKHPARPGGLALARFSLDWLTEERRP